MVEFNRLETLTPDGSVARVTIATGPVVIENGKVLLDKHGEDAFWKFPGGKLNDGYTPRTNAIKEIQEELGVGVELFDRSPVIVAFDREKDGLKEHVILVHYLAKLTSRGIRPGRDVREFIWADIKNLPADCAPNIKPVVEKFAR